MKAYKQLVCFNQSMSDGVAALTVLQKTPELKHLRDRTYLLKLEELRALVAEEITATLSEFELKNAASIWRKRKNIEKQWKKSAQRSKTRRAKLE